MTNAPQTWSLKYSFDNLKFHMNMVINTTVGRSLCFVLFCFDLFVCSNAHIIQPIQFTDNYLGWKCLEAVWSLVGVLIVNFIVGKYGWASNGRWLAEVCLSLSLKWFCLQLLIQCKAKNKNTPLATCKAQPKCGCLFFGIMSQMIEHKLR